MIMIKITIMIIMTIIAMMLFEENIRPTESTTCKISCDPLYSYQRLCVSVEINTIISLSDIAISITVSHVGTRVSPDKSPTPLSRKELVLSSSTATLPCESQHTVNRRHANSGRGGVEHYMKVNRMLGRHKSMRTYIQTAKERNR